MKKFISIFTILTLVLALSSCSKGDEHGAFGYFDYNGIQLISFSTQDIALNDAKGIVGKNESSLKSLAVILNEGEEIKPSLPDDVVNTIAKKYASLSVSTYFYIEEEKDRQVKTDMVQGTDFISVLEKNEFAAFNQLIAQNIIITPEILDFMEVQNEEFKNSEIARTAPFKNVFTYHTNEEGNLVVQYHAFTEIPSSIGGGVGCFYRQDTEMLFDAENKMSKWQTSLGIYTSTPEGTVKQGYILEMEFKWTSKQ